MRIRPGSRDDAADIGGLLAQLGYPAEPDRVEHRLKGLLEEGAAVFVAESDGLVVGLAVLQVTPVLEYDAPAGRLAALVVDERHRRRGIGEALVRAVEDEARSRGCVLAFLTTAERRKEAHAFYRRIGWDDTGRRFAKML